MKYSPGDKIRLKMTEEEGEVISILDEDMVEVEVHGVRFPAFVDDLEHPYLYWFEEQSKKKKEAKTMAPISPILEMTWPSGPRKGEPAGIHLALLPEFSSETDHNQVEALKIFLVHHMDKACFFDYSMKVTAGVDFHLEGRIEPGAHLYLHRFDLDLLNEQPRFYWELQAEDAQKWEGEEGKIRIKPRSLFEHFAAMEEGQAPFMLLTLIREWKPWKAIPLPSPSTSKPSESKPKAKGRQRHKVAKSWAEMPRYELDLHIEAILPQHRGMSAAEILRFQTQVLEREVYLALSKGADRMVIIHGLGKGVLRHQVHQFLDGLEGVKSYHNDWHPRYGFGATHVFFDSRC